jgi:hypothetical protein
MNLAGPMDMSQQDEMPDLSLDFSAFDLSQFVTADDDPTSTQQMHMHSTMSGSHSTHTSPLLNPSQTYQDCFPQQMVNNNEVARLQHHLEQQRRLNELNQLQNRILQQQVRLPLFLLALQLTRVSTA